MKNDDIDVRTLEGLIDAIDDDPSRGATVWKAHARWLGALRTEAEMRGFRVTMDQPETLGGKNSAPNMVEMVLGAYGACLVHTYVLNATRFDIPIDDVQVAVEGDLDLRGVFHIEDPDLVWPGFSRIRAGVTIAAPRATAQQIHILHEAVRRTSPVGSILERRVQVEVAMSFSA